MARFQSAAEKAFRRIVESPQSTPADLAKAGAGLERIRRAREKRETTQPAAALPEVLTKPAAELDAETLKELQRRGLDGPAKPCAACGDPMGWRVFDDRVFCWRHTPARTMPQRDGLRLSHIPCAAPDCPNFASHQKSGKDYCWSHYPNFPQ